jgi:hypothetical protein
LFKSLSVLSILSFFIVSVIVADTTYWIEPQCKEIKGFEDAVKEVIWSSGRLRDELISRNGVLDDPLKWFFNFDTRNINVEKVISGWSTLCDPVSRANLRCSDL